MREKKPYTNLGGASRISFQYLLKADYKRGQISTFPGHRKNFPEIDLFSGQNRDSNDDLRAKLFTL